MAVAPSPREVARYVGSIARFAADRGGRERHDQDVLRDLAWQPQGLAPGLEVEWLGTAGYRLTYEGRTLLLDPYVSRVPLADVVRRRVAHADSALHDRLIAPRAGEVVGILVGHTHFDHAIDVPALARRFGTSAYGSRSLAHLMDLHGLADRAVVADPHHPYELGPFTVRFVPSVHSRLILGAAVPYAGELTCEHLDGLVPSAYRCGDVFALHIEVAGTTLYHQGSADLIDDQVPRGGVDVFLAGIAGRGFTRDYWQRILPRLQPRTVVASHFDDFFRPATAELGFSLNVNLAAVPDEIAAVTRGVDVATLAPFVPVRG